MKNPILTYASLSALGTALYIAVIASLIFYAPLVFGNDTEDTVLIPIAMLLLFVLSASVTGLLVLGRPIFWYLDGKKTEAVSLLAATLGCLSVITLCAFFGLAAFAK